jgi:hypothetical protein
MATSMARHPDIGAAAGSSAGAPPHASTTKRQRCAEEGALPPAPEHPPRGTLHTADGPGELGERGERGELASTAAYHADGAISAARPTVRALNGCTRWLGGAHAVPMPLVYWVAVPKALRARQPNTPWVRVRVPPVLG